jgi:Lipoprotein LpqB beta-propeller domain
VARKRRLWPGLSVELAAVVVAIGVAGCATAPSGGPPRRATGGGSQVQAYVQPLPPPGPTDQKQWGPTAVVLGFLHASASYVFDAAAAEQYLVPALRKSWHPGTGPVAVLGAPTGLTAVPYRPHIPQPLPAQQLETVRFTGQRLATLSQSGQYQYSPGQDVKYEFILAKIDGVWLIKGLPKGQPGLLLTQSDFEEVYQARNLFFYAPQQPAGVLVPDPVYAPLQSSNSALNTNLATHLVNGLLKGQGDWLSPPATWSAFPPGTHLLEQVTISGRTAKVDLGGGAAHATKLQIQEMQSQLLATLRDGSYSAPLANRLQLYINNRLEYQSSQDTANLVPPVLAGPVFVVTGGNTVGELSARPKTRAAPDPAVEPAQIGRQQITAVAALPARSHVQRVAVAVRYGTGCAVYVGAIHEATYRPYVLASSGGSCTSLSWDNNGNLWAAAGQKVWVLRPQDHHPIAVDVTAITAIGQSGARIMALRMAPDSVRAALLVHTKTGNGLFLAAVRFTGTHGDAVSLGQPVTLGTGAPDPIAVSWSDAYHLVVLAGGAVFEMPLTGGAGQQPGGSPQSLGTVPSGALMLTTDGSELVVGTSGGQIYASSTASPGWFAVAAGANPVYPG